MDPTLGSPFEGYVDHVDNGWIFGWAWNKGLPDHSIEVDVYAGGVKVTTGIAGLYRHDLEVAGIGNGRHAFEVAIPAGTHIDDGSALRVCFGGLDLDLVGSPVSGMRTEPLVGARAGEVAGPRYRSRFGGLWIDLSNADAVIDGKLRLGWITSDEAALLRHWRRNGFVILQQVVSHDVIDQLDADVERIWSGNAPERYFVEYFEDGAGLHRAGPRYRDKRAKLLDLYGHLESARKVVFSEPILRFISLLFERPVLAFQCLYFRWGSRQDIHQDTAFVKVSSPLEFVASWVALEDIQPSSGELEYYKGSHKLEDYLFEGLHKWMPTKSPEYESFLISLHEKSRALGLEREIFRPKKGDALLWSADLAHGGSQDVIEGVTRKSIVTHYCPIDCDPVYADGRRRPERHQYNEIAHYVIDERG